MCGESFRDRPLPPTTGGHDVSSVDVADARAFLSAYLNNQPVELEKLRARLAPATVVDQSPEARQKRYDQAAHALAAFIEPMVDEYGEDDRIELEVTNDADECGEDDADALRALTLTYVRARRAAY
jgi:hypothetical protein